MDALYNQSSNDGSNDGDQDKEEDSREAESALGSQAESLVDRLDVLPLLLRLLQHIRDENDNED